MKIIINGRFLTHRTTGVERYAREIINELDKLAKPGQFELAVPQGTTSDLGLINIPTVTVGRLQNRLWEHLSFPRYVRRQGGISLNLCNVSPLPQPGIVCIHDVKVKVEPEAFSTQFRLWYNLLFTNAAKRAKHIITVSDFSKREIMKYYHVPADRITVAGNAWQHYQRIEADPQALAKYGLDAGDYFFTLGSLEPNKNLNWTVKLAEANPNEHFAVAGALNEQVFSDGMGFNAPANLAFLGFVSDGEAKTLMARSKAFLFPTFYEGFGIPPLEALAAGATQVVVSNTAVMHEIFDASVVYVDPMRTDYATDELLTPPAESPSAVLNRYSWAASARQVFTMLTTVVG